MKPRGIIGIVLGAVLVCLGVFLLLTNLRVFGLMPVLIGGSLIYLGIRPGRTSLAVFGHACIVVGCILTTLGIYLLPHSQPTLAHVFTRPLFWGLFSILGGVCALYHAFCNCVRRRAQSDA